MNAIEPVVKEVWVPVDQEAAFRRFTEELHLWWPRGTHSVSLARCMSISFGTAVGEAVYETDEDGNHHPWGDILAWQPPERFVITWHPGREPETAQELEVTFTRDGEGTRVELAHRGWELLGPTALEVRSTYVRGWDMVLSEFTGSMQEPS